MTSGGGVIDGETAPGATLGRARPATASPLAAAGGAGVTGSESVSGLATPPDCHEPASDGAGAVRWSDALLEPSDAGSAS